ncbi:MAG: DUF6261 family protein [Tannerellaceae bacterium]|nr:DUF6261 family protein [Tannerellaceae bacterium]
MHNILEDFNQQFGSSLKNTGLEGWVNELKKANDEFVKLTHERRDKQQVLVSGRSKSARKQVDDATKN